MKTDTYTKAVLTVIAICLIVLAGKSPDSGLSGLVVPNAHAQGNGVVDVNITQIEGHSIRAGFYALPVNISQINGQDFGKSGPSYTGNPQPSTALPVKITEK